MLIESDNKNSVIRSINYEILQMLELLMEKFTMNGRIIFLTNEI